MARLTTAPMGKPSYTPGPWTARGGMVDSEIAHICRCYDQFPFASSNERDANARLIASAPELLDIVDRLGVYLPTELQPQVNALLARVKA